MQCKHCNQGTLRVYSCRKETPGDDGDCTRIQYAVCDNCGKKSKIIVVRSTKLPKVPYIAPSPLQMRQIYS